MNAKNITPTGPTHIAAANSSAINGFSAMSRQIEITNNVGRDVAVKGIILKYKDGLEDLKIKITNFQQSQGVDLVANPVPLCAIGTPKNSDFIQVYKLLHPMIWPKGTSFEVHVEVPAATTVDAGDIHVVMQCVLFEEGQ